MVNSDLESIVKTIRNQPYILYFHAMGREDVFNDFVSKSGFDFGYTRAIHNMDEKTLEKLFCVFEQRQDLLREKVYPMYNSEYLHKCPVLSYGPGVKIRREWIAPQKSKKFFGLKEEVIEEGHLQTHEAMSKLSDFGIGDDETTYLITLSVDGDQLDGAGRHSSMPPMIGIFTNRENAEKIVEFLRQNKEHYYEIIEAMFPENETPKVYKNLIKTRDNLDSRGLKFAQYKASNLANRQP